MNGENSTMGSANGILKQKSTIPTVDFDRVHEGLHNDSLLVIDVREENEMMNPGRIPGTKHIRLGEIKEAFETLSPEEFHAKYDFKMPNKDKNEDPFVLTCRSGKRAMQAALALDELGYSVAVYTGSFNEWVEKGGKVCVGVNKVDFEDVQRNIEEKSKVLIDVRNPDERKKLGIIPGAENVPLLEIPKAFKLEAEQFESKYGFRKPEKNDEIIVHCMSGKRATTAADMLALLNFDNVQIYKGSYKDWKMRGGEILTIEE